MNVEELEQEQRALAKKQEELAEKLEAIRNPKRKPQPGDVYDGAERGAYILGEYNTMAVGANNKYRFYGDAGSADRNVWNSHTFLGTFDEVFIRRSDVKEIFEWEDSYGDSIHISYIEDRCGPSPVQMPQHLKERIKEICK